MRVTQNTNFQVLHDSLNRSKARMEQYQKEASTMKKLNQPSDDPVGATKILEIRTDKVNHEQFQTNSKLAQAFLNNTDSVLEELSEIVVRAKEIAVGQSSGASTSEASRIGVAEEVGQLYLQAVSAANRRIGDRYLFGGFKTDKPPVDGEGRYVGDDGQMMVEVTRDVFVTMNIPGIEAFNTKPESSRDAARIREARAQAREEGRAPASANANAAGELDGWSQEGQEFDADNINLFQELKGLRIALLTGDIEAIRSTLERFDGMHERIVAMRAKVGARVMGLENTLRALERHDVTNAHLSSSIEDADMVKVMSDLAKEETVFRSALQSSQRLVQPTLMDFLR